MGVDRKPKNATALYVWAAPNWQLGELAFLEELPEVLAVELWRAVLRVRVWSEIRGQRDAFRTSRRPTPEVLEEAREAREYSPDIASALDVIASFAREGGEEVIPQLLRACHAITAWAESHGYMETAMQFAEAAASASPLEPAPANAAARVCRRAGERARAEIWYARAIGLARETQNPREYISGYLGAAAVLRDDGQGARALKLIRRAANTARRIGIRGKAAESYHDALGIAALEQKIDKAVFFARRALSIYPIHHKRLPAFAYDVSFLLVNRGLYSTALSLLSSIVPKIQNPSEQLVVWGTLARAAGGSGNRDQFEDALRKVISMAPTYRAMGAGALYSAAEGARLLEDWDRAEELAEASIAAARANDSVLVHDLAVTLRAEIGAGVKGIPPAARTDPRAQVLHGVAAELGLRLARWRGPSWRPRKKGGPQS